MLPPVLVLFSLLGPLDEGFLCFLSFDLASLLASLEASSAVCSVLEISAGDLKTHLDE